MILIRRAVDKHKAYTVIMLKGEEPRWIPTTDYEHQRILEIYKQDKYYEGIENDFTELKENWPEMFKDITLDKYKEKRTKLNSDFLQSTLDKRKIRSILDE